MITYFEWYWTDYHLCEPTLLAGEAIQKFLATHADAELLPINEAWGKSTATGRQILPGMHNIMHG